jgi:hypothetical protein
MNFENLFDKFSSLHVAVIGDVMLDTYWWGNVERISPEAPVPVVAMQHREQRIGGAGNVALNTVSLGAQTTLFSVTGNDDDAKTLNALLEKQNINTKYIVQSSKRITTNKIRVMSRNQQMLRLDSEITNDILNEDETQLLKNFSSYINNSKPSVVIFEDYNKGVLTSTLIQSIVACVLCLSGKYVDLLTMISFVVVIFYVLTLIGIFVLRKKRPDIPRPYKAFGYPVLPAIYIILAIAFCIGLVYNSPTYSLGGLGIMLLGIPLYFIAISTKK